MFDNCKCFESIFIILCINEFVLREDLYEHLKCVN